MLEGRARGPSIGRVFRVGDRKFLQAAIFERRGQVCQVAIDLERRSGRSEQADATNRVQRAIPLGSPFLLERLDVFLVGTEE
jgi:hypothetical protein